MAPKKKLSDIFDDLEKGRSLFNAQSAYDRQKGGPSSAQKWSDWLKSEKGRGTRAPRGGVNGVLEGFNNTSPGKATSTMFRTPQAGTTKVKPTPMSRTSGVKARPVKPAVPKPSSGGGSRPRVDGVGRGGGIRIGTRRGIGER